MTRTIAIGIALVLVFAVVFAPAALLRTVVPAGAGIDLLEPSGTLWSGNASLYLGGQPAGRLTWKFRPVTVLRGEIGYAVSLAGPDHALEGEAGMGFGAGTATLSGQAAATVANRWLSPYDIAISGDLGFEALAVEIPYDVATRGAGRAAGTVTWTGGPVQYRLSGRTYSGNLPPLVAYLGEELTGTLYPRGGQTPLLEARILPDGFVKVGMTQLLTRMLNNPWPGSHADHDVVLEVEEQLF
jgi:hypothetical protein